jgi:hypothetical protein
MLLVEIDQRLEIDGYNNFLGDKTCDYNLLFIV